MILQAPAPTWSVKKEISKEAGGKQCVAKQIIHTKESIRYKEGGDNHSIPQWTNLHPCLFSSFSVAVGGVVRTASLEASQGTKNI